MDVLLISYTNSLGHAGRSCQLSRRLREMGLTVAIAGGGCFDNVFEETVLASPQIGYDDLRPWLAYYLPGLPFFGSFERDRHRAAWGGGGPRSEPNPSLEYLTAHWEESLRQIAPRNVIADGRPEVYWAARGLGIPYFGLGSFVWTEDFRRVFSEGTTTTSCAADLLVRFNTVGARRGLRLVKAPWEPLLGTVGLLADAVELTGSVSSRFIPMGPLTFDADAGAPLPVFDGNRSTVLVTSGTSRFPLLDQVAQELWKRGVQTVVTGGLRTTESPTISAEGHLHRYVGMSPFGALIRQAALVVCHGGSQTLYHCAIEGCRALVVPQHFDHEANGRLFERAGYAEVVPSNSNATKIADCAMDCISRPKPRKLTVPTTSLDTKRRLLKIFAVS